MAHADLLVSAQSLARAMQCTFPGPVVWSPRKQTQVISQPEQNVNMEVIDRARITYVCMKHALTHAYLLVKAQSLARAMKCTLPGPVV